MNGIEYSTPLRVVIGEMTELVRGQEHALIERVAPLVRHHSVLLNMHRVERIDAAGIAALITLYRAAQEAGYGFAITRAAPRVREILSLVGVLPLLTPEVTDAAADDSPALELTEACM